MNRVRPDDEFVKSHLTEFARAFIVPSSADRYCLLALSKRGQEKWRSEIDHFQKRLRGDRSAVIQPKQRTLNEVLRLIGDTGGDEIVAVFSTNRRLLAGVGSLAEILRDVIDTDIGAIVSIRPGRLAIYWGEEPDAKFLLRRED